VRCFKNFIICGGVVLALSLSATASARTFDLGANNTKPENLPLQAGSGAPTAYQFSSYQNLNTKTQKGIAKNFGLTAKEYQSYLYDMAYTPDKYFYNSGNTNPLWVLAAHSEHNPELFKHYIKQSVEMSYGETARMLLVSQAFFIEAHRLHPKQYAVMTAQMHAKALQSGDVMRMFCGVNGGATCSNILSIAINKIKQTSGTRLDLFLVGSVSKSNVESFAEKNSIPVSMVNKGNITLNFGNSLFKQEESEAHSKLPLPYITVLRDGLQIPVNLGAK
jgi:integrating conjugative element protein (TIGR03759 family)